MMLVLSLLLAAQIAASEAEKPSVQPQLAARGADVSVVFGAGNAIYLAQSHDSGRTFGPASPVASPRALSLGMHRGPRVAYTRTGIVIAAIAGETGGGRDGDLQIWRSTDRGKTWGPPVRVNDIAGSAREGLHAIASDGKDGVFVAWLDLRGKGTRIYCASSVDGGATWSANRLVYESPSGTVCQCCHPSVAINAAGHILVMFRNSLEGTRDMFLVESHDQGRTFGESRKLGTGTWRLEACPMDGGGLALDEHDRVATVWRRDRTVFATKDDAQEEALGPGRNPLIASTRKGLYLVWTSEGSVILRRPGSATTDAVAEGAFPSLVAMDDGSVVAAWESKDGIVAQPIVDADGRIVRQSGNPSAPNR